ncbi:RAF-like serine/threonine-protein kinase 20 [Bidens hawaiensis]|uniref:RAF-like serine/threonine-protein kinase 20 n=1 Tax=Bidens hawaiensis TaxID=980011 RepID=UPI004049EEDD
MTSELEQDSSSSTVKERLVGKSSNNNISLRTGEEFSLEFLQDRGTRRIPNGEMNLNHGPIAGSRSDVNGLLGYNEISGMIGLQRRDFVSNSNTPDIISMVSAPVIGSVPSLPHRASNDSQRDKIKFLCSSGGKILPRPGDGKLRYVGGETHIFSLQKNMSFNEFVKRASEYCSQPHTIKYQLPGEDLDALISVASNEDFQNMIEEYNGLGSRDGSSRLRIFLIPLTELENAISIEADANLQNNPDYQYVAAVNGIVDDILTRNNDKPFSTDEVSQLKSSFDQNPSLPIKHSPFNPFDYDAGLNDTNATPSVLVSPVLVPQDDAINGHAQVYNDSLSDSIEIPILKGRAFHSENRILPPDPVNISVGPDGSQLGIPQSFSDPQLQERGANSVFGSQDGSNFPSTMNFVPPPLPAQLASSFLQGKSVEQYDSINPQVPFEMPNVNPSVVYTQTDFLHQDLKEGSNKSAELRHDYDRNGPPFLQSGNFVNNSRVNHEQIPVLVTGTPNIAPTSITNNPKPISNAAMQPFLSSNVQQPVEHQQQVYTGPDIMGITSMAPSHNNNISDADRSLNDLLSHLSAGLRSDIPAVQLPGSHQKELNNHKPIQKADVSLAQIPTTGAEVRREVKFIDENFYHTKQKVAHLGHEEHHSMVQKQLDTDAIGDVSSEALSTSLTEAVHAISDYSIVDAATENEGKEGPFNNALIAEMEADMYGLQIIKDAELEELRELGSGTYGTVYHGRWRGSDVAIKRIKKSCFSGRSSEQERLTNDFWREAQILSKLHHPNVVAFYGVVPDGTGGTLATVTEFMTHGSLRNVLIKKDRSLDRRRKLIIAMDAAFGMEYLHLKNIVHFDLKCDNLLVNMRDPQRPICKVGDFGLSRIKRNTLVSGGVRGTLPWMAPELLNSSTTKVSEKVDVFSFGITMWEILTGDEPYANMHCGAIIGGIVKDTLRPAIPEKCDPEWRKLMEQCWSGDPTARPSFTEITNRLRSMSKALQANGSKKGQHT